MAKEKRLKEPAEKMSTETKQQPLALIVWKNKETEYYLHFKTKNGDVCYMYIDVI